MLNNQTFASKPIIDPAFTNDGASNSVTKKIDGKYVLRPSSLNIHCFVGDVEVLTYSGFKRFDSLTGDEEVAQVHEDRRIEYVKPTRFIHSKDRGDLIRLYNSHGLDLVCTTNHEFIYWKYGKPYKATAETLPTSGRVWLECAGYVVEGIDTLSDDMKFTIAFQADGSVHRYTGRNAGYPAGFGLVTFNFSRERKISRMLKDLTSKYRWCEIEGDPATAKSVSTRKFTFKSVPNNITVKDFNEAFKVSDFSTKGARAFIDYAMYWDGHISTIDGILIYSSTNKNNVRFMQELCVVAGYKSIAGYQEGSNENQNIVYRLNINTNKSKFSTRLVEKRILTNYIADVYCVTVPSGNIVIRSKGKTLIVGNCPYSYAQNALLGKKSKPSGASAGGTAYHYALELGYEHKIQTGLVPKLSDIQEIGRENWRVAQEVQELHYSEKDSPDKMTDDIVKGIQAYHPIMTNTQPIATEIRLSVALPKASSVYSQISGSMDLLAKAPNPVIPIAGATNTNKVQIVDHKFTTKIATSPKYKLQAGMYRIMAHSNGYDVASTVLHNTQRSQVLKTKVNAPHTSVVTPTWDGKVAQNINSRLVELIDRAEMYHFMHTELGVDKEDAVKVLYPTTTPEVSFLCSSLWCGWYNQCPLNNSEAMPNLDLVSMLSKFKEKYSA